MNEDVTAITGTPGVGKTTAAGLLRDEGFEVLDLNDFIYRKGLKGDKDIARDTFEVDLDLMKKKYREEAPDHDIVEGHLSHHLALSPTIVLRCSPEELKKRMEGKDWHQKKERENLRSEILDVILQEALENCGTVCEVDTTGVDPVEVKERIMDILGGETEDYSPGKVDWPLSMLDDYRHSSTIE